MRKLLLLFILFGVSLVGFASNAYRTRSFTDKIKTVQLYLNDNQLDYPVMKINSSDYITVSFDYMSSDYPHLAYKVQLCRADWTPSTMTEMEYMEGLNEVVIEDPVISTNTTFDYAHFSFKLPNEDLKLNLPGNYVVKVYDTDYPEVILVTGCFSLDENKVALKGNVSGKSVYGVNKEYQHLSFELFYQDNFSALPDELTVVVRQNGRHDNEIYGLKPTYVKPQSLIFDDERKLSFEGSKEYNVLDFSHRFRYSGKIDKIAFYHPYYHVETFPGEYEEVNKYSYMKDVDGHFKVHGQDIWSGAEIDYSVVHFTYPMADPWLDGSVYVLGGFNDNWLDESNKMVYNFERHQYELSMVLKNGGYNYLFVFLPSGWTEASSIRTEGSHWETENSYQIYIYYKPLGSNLDCEQLVGFFEVYSN